MNDAVLAIAAAFVTGLFAVAGQIIISNKSTSELFGKLDKQSELADEKIKGEIKVVNARIDDLTREVRDHNNFARRVPVLEEQVKVLNARIGALESKI